MSDRPPPRPAPGHPRGTLVVMAVYGLLFALGWFAMYALVYLRRGAVTP